MSQNIQIQGPPRPPEESLLQSLCPDSPNAIHTLCIHMGDEMNIIFGAPIISSFTLIVVALLVWWGVKQHYKSRLDNKDGEITNQKSHIDSLKSRIDLKSEDITHLEKTIQQMKQINEQLTESKQIEPHIKKEEVRSELQSTIPKQAPLFTIEKMTRELRWTEEGKDGSYPILPNVSIPDNASLQLLIIATITAIPPLEVRDVRLEITSPIIDMLHSDWMFNQTIYHGDIRVSFNVNSLHPNVYSMKLIINQHENDEATSEPFIIRIDR